MKHTKISLLLEDGLQKAEVILAAKDLINNIQKSIERLAEIEIEDTMPLADTMRNVFGERLSDDFEGLVKSELDSSIEQLRVSKDKISDFITGLEGKFDPSTNPEFSDMAIEDEPSMDVQDDESEDDFGAVPATAGEEDEPVGRKLKESVDDVKKGDKVKVIKTAMMDYLEKNSKSPLNPMEKKYFEELKYNFPDLVTSVVDIKKDGITVVLKKGNKPTTMFIPAMAYKKIEGVNETVKKVNEAQDDTYYVEGSIHNMRFGKSFKSVSGAKKYFNEMKQRALQNIEKRPEYEEDDFVFVGRQDDKQNYGSKSWTTIAKFPKNTKNKPSYFYFGDEGQSKQDILFESEVNTLIRWILTESAQKMNKNQYFDFKSKILAKKKEDPEKLAEWIKTKKK